MTVQELIDKLKRLDVDDECEVYFDMGDINCIQVDDVSYDPNQDIVIIE